MTPDSNSRTTSPAVTHAGDKNCFLLSKETLLLLILFQAGLGRCTRPTTHCFPALSLLAFCRGQSPAQVEGKVEVLGRSLVFS